MPVKDAVRRLDLLDEMVCAGIADGLALRTPDDVPFDGRALSLDGRPVLNFGSCGYLGLEFDPRLQAGVSEAVRRYGTQFASSRIYMQAPPYAELEHHLGEMFGGHVLVAPTTTLGHVAALPVLVGPQDTVIMDQQVHQSVQMAVDHLRCQGTVIKMIRHSDINQLEAVLAQHAGHARIWYLADGVYSMYADIAPLEQLAALLQREERLHLYIDDSHGVGWTGRHGRGSTLDRLGSHERVVVAASLCKSFAAGGAAVVFPNAELKRRVRAVGGPMIFSGPVQPQCSVRRWPLRVSTFRPSWTICNAPCVNASSFAPSCSRSMASLWRATTARRSASSQSADRNWPGRSPAVCLMKDSSQTPPPTRRCQ